MSTTTEGLQHIIEAAIMVAGRPVTKADIQKLFDETAQPSAAEIQDAIATLQQKYHDNSGVELREVASGFQFQAKTEYSPWLTRLWEERPTRYSRAFLETLALIAYRQPITRAEIEEIRGVTVSTNIIKTLTEREWIRIIGYKDVPGKPALYGTTRSFLDDFNLKSLDQLPTLAEIKDLESQEAKLNVQLELEEQIATNAESEAISTANESIEDNTPTELTSETETIDAESTAIELELESEEFDNEDTVTELEADEIDEDTAIELETDEIDEDNTIELETEEFDAEDMTEETTAAHKTENIDTDDLTEEAKETEITA